MQFRRVLAMCFCLSLLLGCSMAAAQINEKSVFPEAQIPASRLDLKLLEIQTNWNVFVTSRLRIAKNLGLIVKTGVILELHHSYDDRIAATAWISYTDEFLTLTVKERKQLVVNVLDRLSGLLGSVNPKTSAWLEKRYIRLNVIIDRPWQNEKKESIRLTLPNNIGIGQAGYKDGQFVYSESYFLNLEVIQGLAKSGDSTKFIIEREVKPK